MNAWVLTIKLDALVIDFITLHICKATSRVGARIKTCNVLDLFKMTCSNAITEKTQVFPVPDFAWTIRSFNFY